MFVLPWNDKYLTGIDIIDKQHKEIISLINMYSMKFEKRYDYLDLLKLVQDIEHYAAVHFQAEESYMTISGYPDSRNHAALHKQMAFELKRFSIKLKEKELDVPATTKEILKFLSDWLTIHINKEDDKFAQFYKEKSKIED